MRWVATSDTDKLDLFLLVGGEELQKLIETLLEQPTNYKSHRPESCTDRPTTKLCCTECGSEPHPKGVPCPAMGKNCLRCRKSNHFARACSSRKPNRFGSQVRALKRDSDPGTSHPEGESEATRRGLPVPNNWG